MHKLCSITLRSSVEDLSVIRSQSWSSSDFPANAYLISWTKLEGTRPVSFASLVPFKKPSKFKLEITFIISFFCIMLLFQLNFNFRRIHSTFYCPKIIEIFSGLNFQNFDRRFCEIRWIWRNKNIRMEWEKYILLIFRTMTIISASFLVSCEKPQRNRLYSRYAMNI